MDLYIRSVTQKQHHSSIYFKNLSNKVKVRLFWVILIFGEVLSDAVYR